MLEKKYNIPHLINGGFVRVGFEWEISRMGFKEFVGMGQMRCGGFEEWVLGNFRDGCDGMLKYVWVAAIEPLPQYPIGLVI